MVSFLTNSRSVVTARSPAVSAKVGVASLNQSPTPTKVSAMSALKQSFNGFSVFDGITGPINTPTLSGAFQVYIWGITVGTTGPGGTTHPIGVVIYIATDRCLPMFFTFSVTGRIIPRVKIAWQQPNDQTLIYTFNNVIIGLLGQGNAGPTAYPILTYMQLNSSSMTYQYQSS